MTSWIRNAPRKKKGEEVEKSYYFQLDAGDYSSQFTSYLWSQMFARNKDKELFVYDKVNTVSVNYELLKNTFKGVAGITFSDSILPTSTSLNTRQQTRLIPYLSSLTVNELRAGAAIGLQWNPTMVAEMKRVMGEAGMPAKFDVGLYLRTDFANPLREVRSINVGTYLESVKDAVKGIKAPTVFVMADSVALMEDFRKRADPSWKVYSFAAIIDGSLGRMSQRARLAAYIQFVTELYILQSCEKMFAMLGSNVGRFLYLTCEDTKGFVSMDTATMTFF